MGTTSSSSQHKDILQKQKRPTIQHQRFKQCQIYPQQPHITTRVKVDFSMFQYQYWQKNLQLIKQDPCSEMLFLPISYEIQKPVITCGTGDNLKLVFENFPFILQQQIRNRSINCPPNYLQQEQLWMLLYTLVKSQHAFANLSLKVGDIHPHNIFINQQGYPRLACQFSFPNEKSNFQKMYYDKIPRYLSPQEMRLCEQGSHPDICYSNTSQAFSIGMTMLGVGILQNMDRVYNMKTYKFNRQYLKSCINKWMNLRYRQCNDNNAQQQYQQDFVTYSDQVKDLIRGLCEVDVNKRYLVSMVYQVLKRYQKKIINLQRFKIEGYFQLQWVVNNNKGNKKITDGSLATKIDVISPRQQISVKQKQQQQQKQKQQQHKQQLQTMNHKTLFYQYSSLNNPNNQTISQSKFNYHNSYRQEQKQQYQKYQKPNKDNINNKNHQSNLNATTYTTTTMMRQKLRIKQLDQSILQQPNQSSNKYIVNQKITRLNFTNTSNNANITNNINRTTTFTNNYSINKNNNNNYNNKDKIKQPQYPSSSLFTINSEGNYKSSSIDPQSIIQSQLGRQFNQNNNNNHVSFISDKVTTKSDILQNIQQKIKRSQEMFKGQDYNHLSMKTFSQIRH